MYEAQLFNTKDADHRSDWCVGTTQTDAKNKAKANYVTKYPHDNLADTEYKVKLAN